MSNNYLQDSKGDYSIMRKKFNESVNSAIFIGCFGIIGSITICILGIIFKIDISILPTLISSILGGVSMLCGVFLGSAFAGKSAQSFAENKENQNSSN